MVGFEKVGKRRVPFAVQCKYTKCTYCREQKILVVNVKIWLNCHKLKNVPCLIMPMSTKCQKKEKKNDN
jgi:hypothetical protein